MKRSTHDRIQPSIVDPVIVTFEDGTQSTYEAEDYFYAIRGATTRKPEGFNQNIIDVTCPSGHHTEAITVFLNLPYASIRQAILQNSYSLTRSQTIDSFGDIDSQIYPSENNGSNHRSNGGPK